MIELIELPLTAIERQPRTRREQARVAALVALVLASVAARVSSSMGGLLSVVAAALAAYGHPFFYPSPRAGRLGANATALVIDRGEGVEQIEKTAVRSAVLRFADGRPTLTLRTDEDRWVFRLHSLEDGARFLAAAGLSETTRPHSISHPSHDLWTMLGVFVAMLVLVSPGVARSSFAAFASVAAGVALATLYLGPLRRRFTSTPIRFDEEHFEWVGSSGARRIAYVDLMRVQKAGPNRLVLVDREGRSDTLELFESAEPDTRRVAFELRLRAVRARRVEPPPMLAVEGDRASWVARLEHLARGGYREGAADPDRLRAVLDEPMAPPLARVGAAIALGALEGSERVRVRVAELAPNEETELALAFAELAEGRLSEATLARLPSSELGD